MSLASIGDQARAFTLRSANTRTKGLLTTLSRELSTGVKSDVPKSVGGDTRRLAGIEHRLRTLDVLRRNCDEAAGRLAAGQAAMAGLQAISSGAGAALLGASLLSGTKTVDTLLGDARSNLDAAIGLLNTESAGEFVFAGSRPGVRPIADAAALLAELGATVAGLTNMDDVIAAVDGFFEAQAGGGGFVDRLYSGGDGARGAVPVGQERGVASDLTAASMPFRDLLNGLALAALAAEGTIGAAPSDRLAAARAAGSRIISAEDGLTAARSAHGVLEEAVEIARTRNAAEASALQIARTDLVSADSYETATALSAAQVQLESLYAVTARLAQLSLAKRL